METIIISIQFKEISNSFTKPTFHKLPKQGYAKYCQFLANATNKKVRMTFSNSGNDVALANGHYFDPRNECTGDCNPTVMQYDSECQAHGWL